LTTRPAWHCSHQHGMRRRRVPMPLQNHCQANDEESDEASKSTLSLYVIRRPQWMLWWSLPKAAVDKLIEKTFLIDSAVNVNQRSFRCVRLIIMAALRSTCGHYIFALWFLSIFFYSSPNLSSRRLDVYHTSTHDVVLVRICSACLKSAARGSLEIQDAKNRDLRTIAQCCWAISSQLRHLSTIGKKLVKQQYLLHTSSQYGELRPTSGWDQFGNLGHPSEFQRVSRLGRVNVRH